jgi:hypothetical protein
MDKALDGNAGRDIPVTRDPIQIFFFLDNVINQIHSFLIPAVRQTSRTMQVIFFRNIRELNTLSLTKRNPAFGFKRFPQDGNAATVFSPYLIVRRVTRSRSICGKDISSTYSPMLIICPLGIISSGGGVPLALRYSIRLQSFIFGPLQYCSMNPLHARSFAV